VQSLSAPRGPLLNDSALDAQLKAAELLNPVREAARKLRDARQLGGWLEISTGGATCGSHVWMLL
jgi:hypothetical protein